VSLVDLKKQYKGEKEEGANRRRGTASDEKEEKGDVRWENRVGG